MRDSVNVSLIHTGCVIHSHRLLVAENRVNFQSQNVSVLLKIGVFLS